MKNQKAVLFFIVLLGVGFTTPGFCISRVGNAHIGDSLEGFTALVPSPYVDVATISGSGVRLTSPVPTFSTTSPQTLMRPSIDIHGLASEYPTLGAPTRDGVRAFFAKKSASWKDVSKPGSCLLAVTADSQNLRTTVVSWGPSRGIVLVSAVGSADSAVNDLVGSLKLNRGACEWH